MNQGINPYYQGTAQPGWAAQHFGPIQGQGIPGNPAWGAIQQPVGGGFVQPGRGSPLVVPMATNQGRLYKLPLEQRDEPVLGWRRYDLVMRDGADSLMLRGARVDWPEAALTAICEMDLDTQIFTMLIENFGDKGSQVYEAYAKAHNQVRPSGETACEEHIRDGWCSCGIYGGAMPWSTMGSGMVVAKCTAWGYVAMDDEENWKATQARIEAIFIMKEAIPYKDFFDWPRVTTQLRQRYECPVFVVEDMDEIPC